MKCPRCHKGEVFKSKNPYNLKRMFQMHEACKNCALQYEIEPGFFYGAMYVSYGFGVAFFVATYVIMEIIYNPTIWEIVIALGAVMVLGSPLIFRFARMTYLNLFVKYNPNKKGGKVK